MWNTTDKGGFEGMRVGGYEGSLSPEILQN